MIRLRCESRPLSEIVKDRLTRRKRSQLNLLAPKKQWSLQHGSSYVANDFSCESSWTDRRAHDRILTAEVWRAHEKRMLNTCLMHHQLIPFPDALPAIRHLLRFAAYIVNSSVYSVRLHACILLFCAKSADAKDRCEWNDLVKGFVAAKWKETKNRWTQRGSRCKTREFRAKVKPKFNSSLVSSKHTSLVSRISPSTATNVGTCVLSLVWT